MVQMSLTVPVGVSGGQAFQFRTPDGRVMQTTVPPGVHSGGSFIVDVQMPGATLPVAQPQPVPTSGANHQPSTRPGVGHPPSGPPPPYVAAPPQYPAEPRGLDQCAAAMAGCSLSGGNSFGGVPMGMPVQPMEERLPEVRQPACPALGNASSPGRLADSMRSNPGNRSAAERHAECPICFEPLHKAPVGVFLDHEGKRVSHHFFRLDAAQKWIQSGNGMCPLTRAPVHSVLPVPDIRTDPDGWFRAVDLDGDAKLSRFEVVECLKAQLPVDNEALDSAVADLNHWMWQQWDKDGSGFIERDELLEQQGLAAYVRTAFHSSAGPRDIPSIERDKGKWYDYWDEDDSGSLEQEEVVRALIKTLKLSQDQERVQQMRATVDAIWPIFDSDGSGSIERDEFMLPRDGLADMILATMQHC